MGSADLHIHTREGDGLDRIEAILEHVEARTDLDVIAITEHDNLGTALRARDLWARGRYRFELVTGAEITTLDGHLLALYIERPVESLRRLEQTLYEVHRAGGIAVVPHPLSRFTRSVGLAAFTRLDAARGDWPDGIELARGDPLARSYMPRARRYNEAYWGLAPVGASDAHFLPALGSARTLFEGSSAGDLRRAIEQRATQGVAGRYPALREIGIGPALAMTIAGLRATPKALGWRRTAWSFVSRYFA
jgi:predicted metal-dependent phosphoesterase TrpH